MTVNQRDKGQRGEREFCKALGEYLGESIQRRLGAARDGGCDVLIGMWAVEVKHVEIVRLTDWWQQAVKQAREENLYPALAYRQSRQPWRVIVPLDVLLFGETLWELCNLDHTATLSLKGFTTVVRETTDNANRVL